MKEKILVIIVIHAPGPEAFKKRSLFPVSKEQWLHKEKTTIITSGVAKTAMHTVLSPL